VRYLLISDGLLAEMPPEAIRAIFAHEIAHIQQKHILYAGLFAVAAAMLSGSVGWGLASTARAVTPLSVWLESLGAGPEDVELLATLTALAATWLWGFGYLSRRFERQCDVIGAWASGPGRPPARPDATELDPAGVAIFASALEQVARLNGISLHRPNWRHGRMADRIAYLHSLVHRGCGREEIDRLVGRLRRMLWAAALLGAALVALRVAMEA
jgi:STE24 endopeptidase